MHKNHKILVQFQMKLMSWLIDDVYDFRYLMKTVSWGSGKGVATECANIRFRICKTAQGGSWRVGGERREGARSESQEMTGQSARLSLIARDLTLSAHRLHCSGLGSLANNNMTEHGEWILKSKNN